MFAEHDAALAKLSERLAKLEQQRETKPRAEVR